MDWNIREDISQMSDQDIISIITKSLDKILRWKN